MNIDEVLISSGIIIFLMMCCIVTLFILYTKKAFQQIAQKKEFDIKIQAAIIAAQELEREELANNLHDDFGPLLGILSRQLKREVNPGASITFTAEDRKAIHDKLDGLMADTRRYSSELYPTQMKHLGLIAALQQNLLDMQSQIETHFFDKTEQPPNLPQSQAITLYRIVNEVLNNILKHANAKELECELMTVEGMFQIQIMHNGIPFTQEMFLQHAESKTGKGCSSILNRTLQLNGTIEFYRMLAVNSCVRIVIPMP
jgi:signal transduction histidine kinase